MSFEIVKGIPQGYRMPAEWEPHEATWLSWPRREGISFPDFYDEVLPALVSLVGAISQFEKVHINVGTEAFEKEVKGNLGHLGDKVRFFRVPIQEPWCRDHGPIFIKNQEKMAIVDWAYNAWGGKYPPFGLDDKVPTEIARLLDLPVYHPGIVMEGGSIELNGQGTLLTTESCLLNPNRNPHLNQEQIEQYLKNYLGVQKILWLGDGIVGDDTDGHIDDLTRFVNPTTVVTVVEDNPQDENYEPLQENLHRLKKLSIQDGTPLKVVTLPMPGPVEQDGMRLPASYANFYICNSAVIVPIFKDPNDEVALKILEKCFPSRKVIGINCRELVWGLGTFHCLTQQQPA